MKKYTAIFFLSISYAFLLGHNFIPHHHPNHNHTITVEHHAGDHHGHENDERKKGDLNHFFSHFHHAAVGFSFTHAHHITNTFPKVLLSGFAVLPDHLSIDQFLPPPLLEKPPANNLIFLSPHTHLYGLRAPPEVFI